MYRTNFKTHKSTCINLLYQEESKFVALIGYAGGVMDSDQWTEFEF